MLNIYSLNHISADKLINGCTFTIARLSQIHKYENGEPTEEIEASKIHVQRSDGVDFAVKIADQGASASILKVGSKVIFNGLEGKFYVNYKNRLDISIKAQGIEVDE